MSLSRTIGRAVTNPIRWASQQWRRPIDTAWARPSSRAGLHSAACISPDARRCTTMNDMFESMERDMLSPWGTASRFPTALSLAIPSTRAVFPAHSNTLGGGRSMGMNLDFHETDSGFEMTADLPGMRKEDITVDVDSESRVLTVSGERKQEREEKTEGEDGERKYHFVECSYGKTSRSIRLPETADTSKANASYENGVLTLTFPKRAHPTARRLQIPVGDGGQSGGGKVPIAAETTEG